MTAASDPDENVYRSFADDDVPAVEGTRAAGSQGEGLGASDDSSTGSRWRAVLAVMVGYGADYFLTEILTDSWFLYQQQRIASGSVSDPEAALVGTPALLAMCWLGSMSSVIGGFVCGSIAKRRELGMAGVQLVLGFVIFAMQVARDGGGTLPFWYYAVTIPAVSAATLGGAGLARARRMARSGPSR